MNQSHWLFSCAVPKRGFCTEINRKCFEAPRQLSEKTAQYNTEGRSQKMRTNVGQDMLEATDNKKQ